MIVVSNLYRRALKDLQESEATRSMLFSELNHRLGNSFAVMHAIIRGTVSESALADRISERIEALARANRLVGSEVAATTELKAIFENEIGTFASPDRFRLEGPPIKLDGQTARSISLIVHELTTNAAKYGALSKPDGVLTIRWVEKEGVCQVHWREVDGPPVKTPEKSGFGTRLIRASLLAVQGELEPNYHADGYCCLMRFAVPKPSPPR